MDLSDYIRDAARKTGFDICGIAPARPLLKNREVLKSWCDAGMNDKMGYLERDIDKRCDPSLLFPGAKSLVVTGLSYFNEKNLQKPGVPVISRYAYGNDYHTVIKGKLEKLLSSICSEIPGTKGRAYVDTAPLLEKAWAREAGMGWQGKHSIIINEKIGSFFFIGILVLNIELRYDPPAVRDLCGKCSKCIELCPTGAINDNKTIDARKCIAHLTLENRGPLPADIVPKLEGRVYGCDRCQEVCPWNRNVKSIAHPEFDLDAKVREMSLEDWLSMSETQFRDLFGSSAMSGVKYPQFKRNIEDAVKSII